MPENDAGCTNLTDGIDMMMMMMMMMMTTTTTTTTMMMMMMVMIEPMGREDRGGVGAQHGYRD